MNKRNVGAHVSAAGGVEKAIERAAAIGANCVQVFAGSPRTWRRMDLSSIDMDKVSSKQDELSVSPIVTHALYIVNFATEKPELLEKSYLAVKNDLEFDALVNGVGVVVHLGSHQGRGWEAVRQQVAEQIVRLLTTTPKEATLLIENSAGQNGKLCSEIEEIRWLLDTVETMTKTDSEPGLVTQGRLGWCFDTCHGWAEGYVLADSEWGLQHQDVLESMPKKEQPPTDLFTETDEEYRFIFDEIEKFDLWNTLKVIHVNDSRDLFASGRDRHANLTEGNIPQIMLEYFVNNAKIKDIPIILEVPGEGDGPDAENVQRLWSFLKTE